MCVVKMYSTRGKILNNVLEFIGDTPMIRLNAVKLASVLRGLSVALIVRVQR
jgi:hypothetical protein